MSDQNTVFSLFVKTLFYLCALKSGVFYFFRIQEKEKQRT